MFEEQFLNLEHGLERTRFRKIYTMIPWILIVEVMCTSGSPIWVIRIANCIIFVYLLGMQLLVISKVQVNYDVCNL